MTEPQVQEIINANKEAGYQGGCKKMFYHMHPNADIRDGIGRHPNSYVDSSMYYKMKYAAKAQDKENLNKIQKELVDGKSPADIHQVKNGEAGINGSTLSN